MTGPRELLDAYAAAEAIDDDYKHPTYEEVAPEAIAALRAVLELHKPDDPVLPMCSHCYEVGEVEHAPWPCPTVQAITKALEMAEL